MLVEHKKKKLGLSTLPLDLPLHLYLTKEAQIIWNERCRHSKIHDLAMDKTSELQQSLYFSKFTGTTVFLSDLFFFFYFVVLFPAVLQRL
jgi:hypothetical protein